MSLNEALQAAGWSDEDLLAALSPPPNQEIQAAAPLVVDLVSPAAKTSTTEKRSPLTCSPCYIQSITKDAKRKKAAPTPPRDDPQRGLRERLLAMRVQSPPAHPTPANANNSQQQENSNPNIGRFATAKTLWCSQKAVEPLLEQPCRSDPPNDDTLIEAADLDIPLQNGWTLFAHQKEAIVCCIQKKRSILAYEMGLGKTLIGLIWAKSFCNTIPNCMAIVIAPCTLLENWKKEASLVGLSSNVRFASWAKIPSVSELLRSGYKSFVLICDEAHAMQTLNSARTQATLALCQSMSCKGVLLATGTPMKNGRPANIYPLLVGIRHEIAKNKIYFEKRYCNARKTKFCPWDISGASNLEELRSLIGNSMLRKSKEECIQDMCSLRRVKLNISIDSASMKSYSRLCVKMKKALAAKNSAHCGLDSLTELRQLISIAKVPSTVDHVVEELNVKRKPVVVFVWFRETVTAIRMLISGRHLDTGAMISCQSITGDITDYLERQRIVDQFQEGKIDVLILTYGVGSTGLTLTMSSRVVLLDRPWTPGDVKQAEDRVRRIGQVEKEVKSTWISGFPYDEQLDALLLSKDKKSSQVVEGRNIARLICEDLPSMKQPKITDFTVVDKDIEGSTATVAVSNK